jgi:outer membrane receptor for ferrienterochelin and colicins
VIDREEIEEKALMTPGSVAMLVGETTGLRVQTNAPSLGAAGVRIQGLRGRYSQLLADGLPLYGAQGDSFSLLQVPPLDLAQVEVIKGAASALYGPAALGGVLNLVSRRATEPSVEALVNGTSLGGGDAVTFLGLTPRDGWGVTVLAGYHGQARRDLDDDGWTDVAGYSRGVVRPRLTFADGRGGSLFLTSGVNIEGRVGGTLPKGVAPDGRPFAERLDTRRGDVGFDRRWTTSAGRLIAVRGSFARTGHDRSFGDARERSARHTWFGEASVMGSKGSHTWVAGVAAQQDRYRPEDVPAFAYTFTTPAVFVQDEVVLGDKASAAVSARVDTHSQYGALVSPRVSLLARPADDLTLRVSGGIGHFAPTPFVEETDETGLSRLVGSLDDLDVERAGSGSADLTWSRGPIEVTGTVFGSVVRDPVALRTLSQGAVLLANLSGPTRTWGTELVARYRREGFLAMASHAWTRSTETDTERAKCRSRHATRRPPSRCGKAKGGDGWASRRTRSDVRASKRTPFARPAASRCCSAASTSDACQSGCGRSSISRTPPTSG